MRDDSILLKDIRLNKVPLSECELSLEIGNYRLYSLIDRKSESFYCIAVKFESCTYTEGSVWDVGDITVTILFNVTAFFDGVRHLEFNRQNKEFAGYIHYPDMEALVSLLKKVREIELDVCYYCDGRK